MNKERVLLLCYRRLNLVCCHPEERRSDKGKRYLIEGNSENRKHMNDISSVTIDSALAIGRLSPIKTARQYMWMLESFRQRERQSGKNCKDTLRRFQVKRFYTAEAVTNKTYTCSLDQYLSAPVSRHYFLQTFVYGVSRILRRIINLGDTKFKIAKISAWINKSNFCIGSKEMIYDL